MDANWMQDEELSSISKDKLLLINSFLTDTSKMSQNEHNEKMQTTKHYIFQRRNGTDYGDCQKTRHTGGNCQN